MTIGIVGGMGLGVILFHVSKYAFVGVQITLILLAIYIMYNTQSQRDSL